MKKTKRLLSTALALGVFSLGCLPTPAAAEGELAGSDVACVWQVKSDTTTIYFVGSLPFLRESDLPLPAQIKMAFDRSERVVFEVDPKESKDEAAGQDLIRMGMFMDGGSIKDTISKDTYKALGDLIAESGGQRSAMDSFRPWFAAVMISMTEMIKQGARPDLGVGDQIEAWAAEEGKPFAGLEGMKVELERLNELPAEVHEFMLESTLEEVKDPDKMIAEMDEGVAAWKRGDVEALEKMDAEASTEMDELITTSLLRARSDNWVRKFERALAGETPMLYSIGIGHLIGEGNVLDKLGAKGFEVSQLKAEAAAPKKSKGKGKKDKDGNKKKKPALIPVGIVEV